MNDKSLNTIATFIAGRLDQANNLYLREELKLAIKYYRALLFKRDFDKRGNLGLFAQHFIVELERVAETDCNTLIVGNCKLSKTKVKIPFPVRKNGGPIFQYVGDKLFTGSYQEQYPETLNVSLFDRFIGNKIKYYYNDGYIYVYGNKYLKSIAVRDAWENPSDLLPLCLNSTNCFADDEPFPVPMDMLQTIITSIISGEFSIKIPNDQETTISNVTT